MEPEQSSLRVSVECSPKAPRIGKEMDHLMFSRHFFDMSSWGFAQNQNTSTTSLADKLQEINQKLEPGNFSSFRVRLPTLQPY